MPPVNSRTHKTSNPPSMISPLIGDAPTKDGKQRLGRRLANSPKCFRSGSNAPRSGC